MRIPSRFKHAQSGDGTPGVVRKRFRRMSRVDAHGGGDDGFEVEGFGELGEGEVEHFGLVYGDGEKFIFAGEDDLKGLVCTIVV